MFTLPINPLQKISAIEADPDDDKFIECAVAAKAGYIVSGDKHLLNLKNYQGIQIMKAAKFLEVFDSSRRGFTGVALEDGTGAVQETN